MRKLCATVLSILSGLGAGAPQVPPSFASAGPTLPAAPALDSASCRAWVALFLQGAPKTGWTKTGARGDPLNVVLVGSRAEIAAAFRTIGWYPADPITLRSAVEITASVVLNVPYRRAPVSDLYLWGRTQDLAFEELAGRSARSRHHIRLWCADCGGPENRPIWLGADTFDASVGRSATTGKITHHIAPEVDRQRDKTLADLRSAGLLVDSYLLPHLGPTVGRNGEGDPYVTDGNLAVGILAESGDRNSCDSPD